MEKIKQAIIYVAVLSFLFAGMAYATVENLRAESGFKWNNNLQDSFVTVFLDDAASVINASISRRYNLYAMINATTFPNSQAQNTLRRINILLAMWYLLNSEFGIQDQNEKKNGDKYIEDAYKILNSILDGSFALTSLGGTGDTSGIEYETVSSSSSGDVYVYPSTDEGRIFSLQTKR